MQTERITYGGSQDEMPEEMRKAVNDRMDIVQKMVGRSAMGARSKPIQAYRKYHKDRNKYALPHQGRKECARRMRQMAKSA